VADRTIQRNLRELEDSGLLEIRARARDDGGRTTNDYYLHHRPRGGDGDTDVTGGGDMAVGGDGDTDVTIQRKEHQERTIQKNLEDSPRDPVWDALVDLFGPPTESTRSLYGRITKSLTQAEANPEQIQVRAWRLANTWGVAKLTITSLEKHWGRFGSPLAEVDEHAISHQRMRNELQSFLEET
jgi:hypothetical protein